MLPVYIVAIATMMLLWRCNDVAIGTKFCIIMLALWLADELVNQRHPKQQKTTNTVEINKLQGVITCSENNLPQIILTRSKLYPVRFLHPTVLY